MAFRGWKPYVPVAQRRAKAARALLKRSGLSPVHITGNIIARSFWGKAWCDNLESYSDYANRLPRGRSYVRNGSVIDLQITPGTIRASVSGSSLYTVALTVTPVTASHWQAICADCAGGIDSLVELLQGRLSQAVMQRICRPHQGLFPAPSEIHLSCTCPDWADMCKHVAAVLYGVGARLDLEPQLLFRLRSVDEKELIANAGKTIASPKQTPAAAKLLAGEDLADLFGLDMGAEPPAPKPPKPSAKSVAPRKASQAKAKPAKPAPVKRTTPKPKPDH